MESFQTLPGTLRQPQKLSPLGAQARAAGEKAGFSLARDTENGPEWVAFSAALKLDYSIDCLILTPLSGQNPLTNETVPLVLTHSYG